MLPVLQIGPLSVPTPGLLILLGIWVGLSLAEKHAPRHGVKVNNLYNLVFIALTAGVVGARLAYVGRYPTVFAGSPLSVFSFTPTLLDPLAGVVVGILAAAIYGQRRGLRFWNTLDALTPLLAVFSIALALANLASGAAFGRPTTLPWGILLWGDMRHPTQVYQALLSGLILAALWPKRGWLWRRLLVSGSGSIFLAFLAVSAASYILVEAFRDDSILWIYGLRAGQLIAWAFLAGALFLLRGKINPQNGMLRNTEKL
jgi:phosphatidylglycerol---prolipoprotein diacylglyceryl transferase